MHEYNLPDFPLWGWMIAIAALVAAIAIPFWMLIRIRGIQRLRARAEARSRGTLFAFWLLFVGSYLVVVWVILTAYLNAWF